MPIILVIVGTYLFSEDKIMRRGTTPTLTIAVTGIDVSDLKTIKVTFEQRGKIVTKETADVSVDTENNAISVPFTQEDTLFFGEGFINVQIRGLLADGVTAIASKIKQVSMEDILLDGVITEDEE